MPTYNRAGVVKETINQVLNQTFTDFELIIYNDGSTDNTVEIINSFRDPRIVLIDCPNLGPPHPLNALYSRSSGKYVIILHDHDFFHPQLIEKSVTALDQYKEVGFVLQGSAWINEDGISNYQEMLHDIPPLNRGRLFGESMLLQPNSFSSIFHACCMVRRSALEYAGMEYNPDFGLYADTDLWLRLLHDFDFIYLKEVLFKFRTRETEGHFLDNRQSEILDWQFKIHKENIKKYFGSDTVRFEAVSKHLNLKYAREQRKVAIQAIAVNNEVLWESSRTSIGNNELQPLLVQIIFKLLNKPSIRRFLWRVLPVLNHLRKKLKKK